MEINYEYNLKYNKYRLYKISIHKLNDIYNEWTDLTITKTNKFNGWYIANIYNTNKENSQEYFISEKSLREATLKELLPHNKPVILSKESKCEYIEPDIDSFNFIIESGGNIIKMNFSFNYILSYFKDLNILYVYDGNNSDYNVKGISVHSSFIERHIIIDKYGIFSEYNCNEKNREAIFAPLSSSLKEINFSEYCNRPDFDIIPYFYRTYFIKLDKENKNVSINTINTTINDKQKLFYNTLLPDYTNLEFILKDIVVQGSEYIKYNTELII